MGGVVTSAKNGPPHNSQSWCWYIVRTTRKRFFPQLSHIYFNRLTMFHGPNYVTVYNLKMIKQ